MEETIVLFPYSSGMGHLIPMVELAKQFAARDFSVAVLIVDDDDSPSINSSFLSLVSSRHPSISFHRLPLPQIPAADLSPLPMVASLQLVRACNPLVSAFLSSLSQTAAVRALVLDMFCGSGLDVARELNLPVYSFFASAASCLSASVSITDPQSRPAANFKDLGETPLHLPGVPPIPASHMPYSVSDWDSEICKARIYDYERLTLVDGILVNTFESLERRVVEALKDGSRFRRPVPPVYCIGPVVADGADSGRHECLAWLDEQPEGSVVFLCFGSRGSFSAAQLKEIAVGLERSEQRFLWAVRSQSDDELFELLPEGFLQRTKGRGLVVDSWAPQAAVLRHASVGGFVSHCGWNSVLEAVSCGVPIIAWPLYAEQRMNKVFLVEEAKLAVEMKGYAEEYVTAGEVETKVRWLMESEGGRELRNRAGELKRSAGAAHEAGGSSSRAWTELVTALRAK